MITPTKLKEIQSHLKGDLVVSFSNSSYGRDLISEYNFTMMINKPSGGLSLFSIQVTPFYGICGVAMCHNYSLTSDNNYREFIKEFFDWYCDRILRIEIGIGAVLTINYTGASIKGSIGMSKAIDLKFLGFEIVDWYNNPRHVLNPSSRSHWIQGVWIKKLDTFDVGLTKEEMNNFKCAL